MPTRQIQRLLTPIGKIGMPLSDNDTGLNRSVLDYMNSNICRFDYMGDRNFEGGKVKEALLGMINLCANQELVTTQMPIKVTFSEDDIWNDTKKPMTKTIDVFIIAANETKDDAVSFIKQDARQKREMEMHYPTFFVHSVFNDEIAKKPNLSQYSKHQGWFDLNNNFMYFTDKGMFDKFKEFISQQAGQKIALSAKVSSTKTPRP